VFGDAGAFSFDVVKSDNVRVVGFGCDFELSIVVGAHIVVTVIMEGVVCVIVLFHGSPAWIRPVVKLSIGCIEFIGKNELVRDGRIKGWIRSG